MMITMLMAAALGQAASAPAQRPRMDRGARMDRMFDLADTDRNGQVSRAEFRAARERMQAHRMERRQDRHQGGGQGGRGGWGGKGG